MSKPNPTTNQPDDPTTKSSDDVLSTLRNVDQRLAVEQPQGPIAPELVEEGTAAAQPAGEAAPSPFLSQTVGALVGKGVQLSKVYGWSGPAVEGVFTEQEWTVSVATHTAIVIQRRWPTLAENTTPELALLLLVLPWAMWAIPAALPAFMKLLRGKRNDGTSDSDTRRDGNRQDYKDARAAEPAPSSVPSGSD